VALSFLHCEGFEHGVASASGTGLGNTISAGCSIVTAGVRSGTYAMRITASASIVQWQKTLAANAKGFLFCAVKVISMPSAAAKVMRIPATTGGQTCPTLMLNADGTVTMRADGSTTGQQVGPNINDGNWHVIAMQADLSGTTWTVDWWVDGTQQTQAATAGHAADTCAGWGLGITASGTVTYEFDDVIYGNWVTAGTDFITNAEVLGYVPGSDGTHNVAANQFFPGDTGGAAYTNGTTTAYQMVDELPFTTVRSTTDCNGMRVLGAANYIEHKIAATASGKPDALCVVMQLAYSSSATTANKAACEGRNGDGVAADIWGLINGVGQDYSETTNFFKSVVLPAPGAGWTKTELDKIVWRFGGCTSGDISPVPTVQQLLAQVAYPIAAGGATTPISIAAGLTLTPTVGKVMTAPRAISVGLAGTPTINRKQFSSMAALLSANPALVKAAKFSVLPSAGLTLTPTLTRIKVKPISISGSLVLTSVLTRIMIAPRAIAAGLTLSPALNRKLQRLVPAGLTLTPTMTLAKKYSRAISAGLTLTGAITFIRTQARTFSANLTLAAAQTMVKTLRYSISSSLTTNPTLNRKLFRTAASGLTLTGVMTLGKKFSRTIAANLTLTNAITLRKTFLRALQGSLSLSAVIQRVKTGKVTLAAPLTLTAAQNRKLRIALLSNLVLLSEIVVHPRQTKISLPVGLNLGADLQAEFHPAADVIEISLASSLLLNPTLWVIRPPAEILENILLSARLESPILYDAQLDDPEISDASVTPPTILKGR
jgi:hypothetical protein